MGMPCGWKRILGFILPIFISAVVAWSYYVFVVLICFQFYNSIGLLPIGVFLALIAHVILFLFFWSWGATIFTNPGRPPPDWFMAQPDDIESARIPAEAPTPVRYCRECKCIKPERTHHCSICDACVLKMDHHCPWMNNCVGFRNYKYFIQFLSYTLVYCAYLMVASIHRLTHGLMLFSASDPTNSGMHILIMYIVAFSFTGGVVFLLAFHIRLVGRNSTTLEDMGGRRSPYDLGSWKDNAQVVFGRRRLHWFLPIYSSLGNGITWTKTQHPDEMLPEESAPLRVDRSDSLEE
eukprot:TRINITY_DN5073_c0_g1_i1.p1 TRINITY_DN5073_c0_g1~~TRINITY_DN5073_c0_g1_i1.p1  ORF type:complete len:333 (-),score=24.66 TRINITY_DN5073_c0_g1_i1:84-962(-)